MSQPPPPQTPPPPASAPGGVPAPEPLTKGTDLEKARELRLPTIQRVDNHPEFRFDGGAATFIGTGILAVLVIVLTFGIAYPFAVVLLERWKAKHTYIGGRRLKFTGSATGLWLRWILWEILIILSLGIYLFWVVPRMTRWKVEHQTFDPAYSVIDVRNS